MRKVGERACDRLIERITDPSLRPKVELLPTELVLRSSCGCPPGTVARQQVIPQVTTRVVPQQQKSTIPTSPKNKS
jgi:hypothetical protein